MEIQRSCPSSFVDILYESIGENIRVVCRDSQKWHIGTLIDVSSNSIDVLGTRISVNIPLNNIFSVFFNERDVLFLRYLRMIDSELYQKFSTFLHKKIEVFGHKSSGWHERGELQYIGKDYFILINSEDKHISCVYVNKDTEVCVNSYDS